MYDGVPFIVDVYKVFKNSKLISQTLVGHGIKFGKFIIYIVGIKYSKHHICKKTILHRVHGN